MKILTAGHRYELVNFEAPEAAGQVVQFIEKNVEGDTLTTVADGTTNEEVLQMLLDRLNFLQTKSPCAENAFAIANIFQALTWLGVRTANRQTHAAAQAQAAAPVATA